MSLDPVVSAANRIAAVAAELGLERPTITPLPGGLANHSFRLRDARQDLVLRLADAAGPSLGADRALESAMLRLAAAAGLAPPLVLAIPEEGLFVLQYVDGRTPNSGDMRDRPFLARIGAWLARLHAIPPPPLPPIDFGARAAAYLERLQAQESTALTARIARRLAKRRAMLSPATQLAACHHDLHRRNFVDTGQSLVVLDWEYAGPGDPAADLASCIRYHDLEPGEVDALLAGYGQDSRALRARLLTLGWIFDCLWFGWNAVAAQAGLESDPELQERLGARLVA